jgi:hypothetical protein
MIHAQNAKITQMVAPVKKTTGGATVTANLDMLGYNYASIVVSLSAYDTPSQATAPVISLLESDDTVVSNFATYVADKGSAGSAARNYVYHIDMRGRKRYQRISVTNATAGTDNAIVVSVAALQSRAKLLPASTTDMAGSTNDVVTIP